MQNEIGNFKTKNCGLKIEDNELDNIVREDFTIMISNYTPGMF